MGESRLIVDELLALCLQRITVEEDTLNTEREFVNVVKNFENVRKQWLHAELELKKYKELLVKSDVAKAALEVKLKHARNQLDVEMKKRYKMESDYQYLQRQMQLMCDILVHDSKSNACLNDEQKSLLAAFEHKGTNVTQIRSSKRLYAIDESSFLSHSDISYDRTDDDMDLDTTAIKPLRSRARERRRSSMGPAVGTLMGRRGRGGNLSSEQLEPKTVEKVDTIMKASVTAPDTRGPIHMVVGITQESQANPNPTVTQECLVSVNIGDDTSVWFPPEEMVPEPDMKTRPSQADKELKHVFVSRTMIRPEPCLPCGKRIRFGKVAVKCRNCRVVAHPECKQKCPSGCSTATKAGASAAPTTMLEGFAPATHPKIPLLIAECVKEIERRGLQERGLYRVPGGERQVKELRDRFLGGKTPLQLSKVSDVHVICGVLKDFLRKLKEPLVTYRLHRTFMEASEMNDEENSAAILFRAIAELPKTNRDTLAFLMLHMHKVMRSPQCQMDQNNLSRVFGPTLVGHGMSEPSPTTILRDTNTQPKVICRLLSLPEDHWRRILKQTQTSQTSLTSLKTISHDEGHARLFEPLTSPELNTYRSKLVGTRMRGRVSNMGNALSGAGRVEPSRRFFTSPN